MGEAVKRSLSAPRTTTPTRLSLKSTPRPSKPKDTRWNVTTASASAKPTFPRSKMEALTCSPNTRDRCCGTGRVRPRSGRLMLSTTSSLTLLPRESASWSTHRQPTRMPMSSRLNSQKNGDWKVSTISRTSTRRSQSERTRSSKPARTDRRVSSRYTTLKLGSLPSKTVVDSLHVQCPQGQRYSDGDYLHRRPAHCGS